MDADRFDRIAKTLTTQPSRRRMLRALASLALGGAVVSASRDEAAADHCRAPGKPCRKGTQCCSGFCNKRRGKCKDCPHPFYFCEAQDGCISKTKCCDDDYCAESNDSPMWFCGPDGVCFCDEEGGEC